MVETRKWAMKDMAMSKPPSGQPTSELVNRILGGALQVDKPTIRASSRQKRAQELIDALRSTIQRARSIMREPVRGVPPPTVSGTTEDYLLEYLDPWLFGKESEQLLEFLSETREWEPEQVMNFYWMAKRSESMGLTIIAMSAHIHEYLDAPFSVMEELMGLPDKEESDGS